MRPVFVVLKLVGRQPPLVDLLAHVGRHALVVGHEIVQALLIVHVRLDDLAPALVGRVGVVVVEADVVGAERAVVVRVRLVIRDGVELFERAPPARVKDAQQQLVLRRVVIVGLREGHAVVGVVGQAHAKAVRLHLAITRPVLAGVLRADPR